MSNSARMPIGMFVDGVKAAIVRRDGYIMGAKVTGTMQNNGTVNGTIG